MAETPRQTNADVAALVALYVLAEQQLIAGFAAVLKRTTQSLDSRQAAMPKLRRVMRLVLSKLEQDTQPLIERAIAGSSSAGTSRALFDIRKILAATPGAASKGVVVRPPAGALSPWEAPTGRALVPAGFGGSGGVTRPPNRAGGSDPFDFGMSHQERSARAIVTDLTSELDDVRFRITRLPDDIYKTLAPRGAIAQVLGRGLTPEQAQAIVWRDFIANGITGFTDKSGRDWSLSAYTEMAVRTASQRAFNTSHLATMHASGIHLFTVPDDGHPCPLCFPWQNAVLSDGPVETTEQVDGTIEEATKAGLFHPNCEHTLVAYIPGITARLPMEAWSDAQDAAYKLTQKQRRYELNVRKAKRQLEHALTPQAQRDAAADLKDAQRRVRELVKANPAILSRQSRREQVDLRNPTTKLPELT